MTIYLDTSAAAKLLVDEAESEALVHYLDTAANDHELVSSALPVSYTHLTLPTTPYV